MGHNWVSRFVKRHNNKLYSIFLDSIDYARRIAIMASILGITLTRYAPFLFFMKVEVNLGHVSSGRSISRPKRFED